MALTFLEFAPPFSQKERINFIARPFNNVEMGENVGDVKTDLWYPEELSKFFSGRKNIPDF